MSFEQKSQMSVQFHPFLSTGHGKAHVPLLRIIEPQFADESMTNLFLLQAGKLYTQTI